MTDVEIRPDVRAHVRALCEANGLSLEDFVLRAVEVAIGRRPTALGDYYLCRSCLKPTVFEPSPPGSPSGVRHLDVPGWWRCETAGCEHEGRAP